MIALCEGRSCLRIFPIHKKPLIPGFSKQIRSSLSFMPIQEKIHYDAFISYRHTPRDTAVAAHLQRALETYRIPRFVRRSLGIDRIGRIFRDKEELEVTSDLRHTIAAKLANSDYLILICSPDTPSSEWVRWEIDTFLETHEPDKILTVVAGGNPSEVIQGALAGARARMQGAEPLACNYLGHLRTADKVELPRLAAAILECPYALLMQRQRAYRLRRATHLTLLALTGAFVMIFYMASSRHKIEESYRNALRSQAISMAAESTEALGSYDFISAISMALGALPSKEKPDIPVTAQAQSALTDAVGAYHMNELALAWTFEGLDTIVDFQFSTAGSALMALDTSNTLSVWDCKSLESLLSLKILVENAQAGFLPYRDKYAIVWNGNEIRCLDYRDTQSVWASSLVGTEVTCQLSDDESALFLFSDQNVSLMDPSTGTVLHSCSLKSKGLTSLSQGYALFRGNSQVVFLAAQENASREEVPMQQLVLWNYDTGEVTVFESTFRNACAMTLTTDTTTLFLLCQDREAPVHPSLTPASLYPAPATLFKIDLPSGKIGWKYTIEGSNYETARLLLKVSYSPDEGITRPCILCAFSNVSVLLDIETGEALTRSSIPGSLLACLSLSKGSAVFLTADGMVVSQDLATGIVNTVSSFHDSITQARTRPNRKGYPLPDMALCAGNQIFYYSHLSDPSSRKEASVEGAPFRKMVRSEDGFMLQDSGGTILHFVQPEREEGQRVATVTLPEAPDLVYYLVGAGRNGEKAYVLSSNEATGRLQLLIVSPSGTVRNLGGFEEVITDLSIGQDVIPYVDFTEEVITVCDMERNALYRYDLATRTGSFLELQGLSDCQVLSYLYLDKVSQSYLLLPSPVVVSPTGDRAFVTIYDEECDTCLGAIVDLESGETTLLVSRERLADLLENDESLPNPDQAEPEDKEEETEDLREIWCRCFPLSEMGVKVCYSTMGNYLALLYETDILLWTESGGFVGSIAPPSLSGVNFHFLEGALMVLSGNTVSRYSLVGEPLSSIKLSKGHAALSGSVVSQPRNLWDDSQPYLFLSIDNNMFIINTLTWEETSLGSVSGYLFHSASQDRFYTFDASDGSIVSYVRHSLDELIRMGRGRLSADWID